MIKITIMDIAPYNFRGMNWTIGSKMFWLSPNQW